MNIITKDKERSAADDKLLRKYLKDVIAWHGYIRFLGMPDLQENPDVSIDELYVGQSVSRTHLSTDNEPKNQDLINPIRFLIYHKQITVLGDPGSGKSTLVNWLAWYLSKGLSIELPEPIGRLIPIPLVLRDLDLNQVESLDDLLDAFLKRPLAAAFAENKALLKSLISNGKTLLLLDGLDEISDSHKDNVEEIIKRYKEEQPDNFLISTSRIVGFEKPQNKKDKRISSGLESDPIKEEICASNTQPSQPLEVCYVAPFTNKQVRIFSGNWFEGNYRGNKVQGAIKTSSFIKAIQQNNNIQSLSRTPQLLTMMALIFKIKADLPNGRALLYEMIAQAYLQSIDKARELSEDRFTWQEKKLWLARIAFEMQSLREQNVKNSVVKKEKKGKINNPLVDKSTILGWICDEMEKSKGKIFKEDALNYLTWVARRSGLLLPRGEEQYAFIHLSFQEYFASVYIQSQLENPDWLDPDEDEKSTLDYRFVSEGEANKALFINWTKNKIWNETLTFLFETMDLKRGWTKKLWNYCFPIEKVQATHKEIINSKGDNIFLDAISELANSFTLQISLFENTHITTEGEFFNKKFRELVNYACQYSNLDLWMYRELSRSLGRLISLKKFFELDLEKSEAFKALTRIKIFDLDKESANKIINNLNPQKLTHLAIADCDFLNIEAFTRLTKLRNLSLHSMKIDNFSALERLTNVENLSLWGLEISDLSFLKNMNQLQGLDMRMTAVEDISALANHTALRMLFLHGNKISDLSPLLTLSKLNTLLLDAEQKKAWGKLVKMHPDFPTANIQVI